MTIPLRNHPGILVVIAVIIALLAWSFGPKPIVVDSTTVKLAPLTSSIKAEGRTRIIDRYIISSPIKGMTCRIDLKVGDNIRQGQTLLEITPLKSSLLDPRNRAQAEAKVSEAKAALKATKELVKSASATAKFANNEVVRYRPLRKKDLISQETYDKALTASLTASANKRIAKFQVGVAHYQLQAALITLEYSGNISHNTLPERLAINSPIDGKILKVIRKSKGPTLIGEALLEIGNPSVLEIKVDVLSADAIKIKPSMKVLFERWGGDLPLEGVVRLIEPAAFTKVSALGVEEQRVWVILDFTSPAKYWTRLGDGYRVDANFILWHENDVLQVPSSALFRFQGGWAVFVIENGQANHRQVTLGQRNGLISQVLTGLVENEKVINHPSNAIEDGVRIKERI